MFDSGQVRDEIKLFILQNFLFGDKNRILDAEESLIETGVIDSTGILELIEFLEKTYSISIEEREMTPENLDGIEKIVLFLNKKKSA